MEDGDKLRKSGKTLYVFRQLTWLTVAEFEKVSPEWKKIERQKSAMEENSMYSSSHNNPNKKRYGFMVVRVCMLEA